MTSHNRHIITGLLGFGLWIWLSRAHMSPMPDNILFVVLFCLALGTRLLGFEIPPRISMSTVLPVQLAGCLLLGPFWGGLISMVTYGVYFTRIVPSGAPRKLVVSTFIFNLGMEGTMFGVTGLVFPVSALEGDAAAKALVTLLAYLLFKTVNELMMALGHALRGEPMGAFWQGLRFSLAAELSQAPAAMLLVLLAPQQLALLVLTLLWLVAGVFAKILANLSNDLKEANVGLARRVDELDSLLQVGRGIRDPFDLHRILDLVGQVAAEAAAPGRVLLLIQDQEGHHLAKLYGDEGSEGFSPQTTSQLVAVLRRQPEELIADNKVLDPFIPGSRVSEVFALLCAGESYGQLLALDQEEDLSKASRRVLEGIALQLAASLRNIHLHREALRALRVQQENRELKALDQKKNEFVQTVAHQFQTPLTSIIGFGERLKEEPQDPDAPASIVVREGKRLSNMVSDLLQLSRIRSGIMELLVHPVSLGDVLREINLGLIPMAKKREVTVDLQVTEEVTIQGDAGRLRLALENLAGNAVKYSSAGGRVHLHLQGTEDGGAVITIKDQGIGIPKEELPLIFNEFFRSKSKETRARKGTGLGLAICKSLVEMHGGSIEVESSYPDGGSLFRVTLLQTSEPFQEN